MIVPGAEPDKENTTGNHNVAKPDDESPMKEAVTSPIKDDTCKMATKPVSHEANQGENNNMAWWMGILD